MRMDPRSQHAKPLSFAVAIWLAGFSSSAVHAATAELPDPGTPECRGTAIEPISSLFDRHVVVVSAAAESDQALIEEILEQCRQLREEWMRVRSSVPGAQTKIVGGIDERIAYYHFFCPTLFLASASSGMSTMDFLDPHGVTEQMIAHRFAAVPERYLRYLESSIRDHETRARLKLPRAPFDLQSLVTDTIQGNYALWAATGQLTLNGLREDLDKLCKADS